jgi:hypothetical protein
MWLKHLKEKVDGCEFKLYYKKIRIAKNFEKTSLKHRLKLYKSFLTFMPRTIYQADSDYIKLKENLRISLLTHLKSAAFKPEISIEQLPHSIFAIEMLLETYNEAKQRVGMTAVRLQKLYPFETDINYKYLTDKEARSEFGAQQVNRAVKDQAEENVPWAVSIERSGKKIESIVFSDNPFNQTAGQVQNVHLPENTKMPTSSLHLFLYTYTASFLLSLDNSLKSKKSLGETGSRFSSSYKYKTPNLL